MLLSSNNPFNNNPKLVIFDLCGTLLNSKELDHSAINYTLRYFNEKPWNITRLKKDPLKSMKNNFPNFFGANAANAYDIYMNYLTENINSISFFEHSTHFLQMLKTSGIQTAIITNRDRIFVNALNNHTEFKKIKPFLNILVIADDLGFTKPSTQTIDYALKKSDIKNCKNEQIIFIGDAFADMKTAINYPCTPILFTATTADITNEFIKDNENKIYIATSYAEIITSLKNAQIENRNKKSPLLNKLINNHQFSK